MKYIYNAWGKRNRCGIQRSAGGVVGAAIKPFPGWKENSIDAFGTALGWGECSVLIACADIIGTNIYNTSNAKAVGQSTSRSTTSSEKTTCRIATTTADYFRQRYNCV